jgi:hypothetical protein
MIRTITLLSVQGDNNYKDGQTKTILNESISCRDMNASRLSLTRCQRVYPREPF